MTHIVAYKGFNADWTCRGFQYEVGNTYKHDGDAVACNSGFHACENPLNVFEYYPPTGKLAEVHMIGSVSREENGDSKVASAEIHIKVELSLHDFIGRAVKWLTDNAKAKGNHATGEQSAASATGYQSAASATGNYSAASATGNYSAASANHKSASAMGSGYKNKVSGVIGSSLFLNEWSSDGYEIVNNWAGIVGRNGVKPDTFYSLVNNEIVEIK